MKSPRTTKLIQEIRFIVIRSLHQVEDTIIGLLKLKALPVPARSSSITAAQAIPIVMIAPTEAFGQFVADNIAYLILTITVLTEQSCISNSNIVFESFSNKQSHYLMSFFLH